LVFINKNEFLFNFRINEDLSTLCSDQNPLCIWYHDDDLSENVQSEMRNRLDGLFSYIRIFKNPLEFAAYLLGPPIVTKIFFIFTGESAKYLCSVVTKHPPNGKMYQFQPNVSSANNSLVFTDFDKLFVQISDDLKTYLNTNQPPSTVNPIPDSCYESRLPPPWSVWNSKIAENSFQCWRKESPQFFLFQALSKILIKMKCDRDQSFADMFGACRMHYMNDSIEGKKIDDFAKGYKAEDAILHYTKDSFLFRLVGKTFRSEDFENIFIFRRYIIDLHWELHKLVKKAGTINNILRLYRGKKLRTTVLQQLKDNIGAFISMNGFLSTTYNLKIARDIFAGTEQNRPDYESVLFEFCINETTMIRTYAEISEHSQYPSEEEVLFSIGSVWRIDAIQLNDDLWTVKLSSCNDVDSRIIQFFEELPVDSTLIMIGDVLLELGQDTKAENFYWKMLKEPTVNNETRYTLYNKIAMINMEHGKYHAALESFSKAEELISARVINMELQTLQPLYSNSVATSRLQILNNKGLSYQKIGDLDNALQCLMEALKVQGEIEPIYKATVYDNLGLIYFQGGQYGKAFENFSEAVKLAQDHSCLSDYKQHYKAAGERLHSRDNSLNKKLNDST
jgi:tetratricopeptide (TPR) repeat protein